jgi:antitoxin PrlF
MEKSIPLEGFNETIGGRRMSDPASIARTCVVSRKGQTTLPLAVRQILGVRDGGEVVVRTDGRRITIEPVEAEHADPAIISFLGLIAADLAAGRNVTGLPDSVAQALTETLDDGASNLDEPIEGDVCL